jgi:hypothetical protein
MQEFHRVFSNWERGYLHNPRKAPQGAELGPFGSRNTRPSRQFSFKAIYFAKYNAKNRLFSLLLDIDMIE